MSPPPASAAAAGCSLQPHADSHILPMLSLRTRSHAAAQYGQAAIAEALLRAAPSALSARNRHGATPFLYAAM